jgi:hypothetical protein
MSRFLPSMVGLAVLLGAGVVHGLWTERWQGSTELPDAAARLEGLPDNLGPWKGQPEPPDPDALKAAGAVGHWSRRFTDGQGDSVGVLLLCGRPGQMAVHRPEHCYRTAGYEMVGAAERLTVGVAGLEGAEFWTARFRKEEADGPVQLRIYWAWSAGGAWQAPDSPRLAFTRQRALYKLYVHRGLGGPQESAQDDPCVALLGHLLPVLHRALAPSGAPGQR